MVTQSNSCNTPIGQIFNPFFDDVWFWTEDMGVRNVDFDTPMERRRCNDSWGFCAP